MSRRFLNRLLGEERGSLPLTLLATIVVAGLIAVVLARVTAGEGAVRFDRDFTETIQVADIGVNRGLFALNEGATPPTAASPSTQTVDGIDYTWWAEQLSPREWQVHSQGEVNDVRRHLVATIEDQPFFFPGAFGDERVKFIGGGSGDRDSFNSDPACTGPASACGWGTDEDFGTGNFTMGTNGKFEFSGSMAVRPGSAFLYDWADNGRIGTATDPFGDRCSSSGGTPKCTAEYVSTVPERLEFDSVERMGFIDDKFAAGGDCVGATGTRMLTSVPDVMQSFHTASGNAGSPVNNDPSSSGFTNFYCADVLTMSDDLELDSSVTTTNPVVIFVKDYVKVDGSQNDIACHNDDASVWCDGRNITPQTGRLQIYVAGIPLDSNGTAGDINFRAGTSFSGVVYAPRSVCGAGNGGVEFYGSLVCRDFPNVGNFDFHYDDALGVRGSGQFAVAFWEEVDPVDLP